MNDARLPRGLGKAEGVVELGKRAGFPNASGWGERVPKTLAEITAVLPPLTNTDIDCKPSDQLSLNWLRIEHPRERRLAPWTFLNGRPDCFPARGGDLAFSPGFSLLKMAGGYIGHFFGGPLAVTPDGSTIVEDVSSRYAALYRYYDFDLAASLKDARYIDGTVITIADDIRPLNYCQWIANWLPRLAFLGAEAHRKSIYVVTTPVTSAFQRDTLRMCGFDESRIIQLDEYSAIRARELLVPSDLRMVPHPIHKMAPWALSYMRATVGVPSLMAEGAGRTRGRLYVSRNDAWRRKVANDAEVSEALARRGYRTITLSDLTIAQQVAEFAYASHVVSLHGAGLTNLIFAQTGTQVIEIFPRSYGTPAFGVIAVGLECPYASYIADETLSRQVNQFDDVHVNIDNFFSLCDGLL